MTVVAEVESPAMYKCSFCCRFSFRWWWWQCSWDGGAWFRHSTVSDAPAGFFFFGTRDSGSRSRTNSNCNIHQGHFKIWAFYFPFDSRLRRMQFVNVSVCIPLFALKSNACFVLLSGPKFLESVVWFVLAVFRPFIQQSTPFKFDECRMSVCIVMCGHWPFASPVAVYYVSFLLDSGLGALIGPRSTTWASSLTR